VWLKILKKGGILIVSANYDKERFRDAGRRIQKVLLGRGKLPLVKTEFWRVLISLVKKAERGSEATVRGENNYCRSGGADPSVP